jgi:hypothetical protein
MAQGFAGGIQAIGRFVGAAAGIMALRWNLLACINAGFEIRFAHAFILCGETKPPAWRWFLWDEEKLRFRFCIRLEAWALTTMMREAARAPLL